MPNSRVDLPRMMECARSERPLRIALVYSRLPFPMMRGDQLTVAHLISFLAARGHAVDLYTLDMHGELGPDQRAWLEKSCRQLNIYRQSLWSRLTGLIGGLFRRQPMQVGLFQNGRLTRDLRQATTAGRYDVIYSYYMRSAPAIPVDLGQSRHAMRATAGRPKTFLALQLSQALNSRRIRDNERNRLKKLIYRVETRLCEAYEARVWQDFTRSVLIGPADVAAIRAVCAVAGQPTIDNWVYGAHGTDVDRYQPGTPDEVVPGRVVFSGSMLYQPNIQAALWFAEQCWPRIREKFPTAEFVIQGRDPSAAIRALDGIDGIVVTGTVPDVGHYIRSATVCINPMLAAGGMQNKLIEYMASARAVVATTIANEGVMAPDDTLCIADNAEAFAEAVMRFLDRPDLALELGHKARTYVAENWTWEAHFLKLEKAFHESLDPVKKKGATSLEVTGVHA